MKKICIIGAGVSGLFLANIIKNQAEFDYKIIEKRPNFNFNEGYGIQLSVNSIKLLNNIGFKNLPESEVYLPKKVNFFQAHNLKKICDIDLTRFNDDQNRYTTLKRSTLLKFLSKNIPKEKIKHNTYLEKIENNDQIVTHFSDKTIEHFDYVVIADGIFSKSKSIISKGMVSPKFNESIAIRGNLNENSYEDVSIFMGSHFHYVIYPVNQNREYNFVAVIKKKLNKEELFNEKLFKNNDFLVSLMQIIYKKSDLKINNLQDIKAYPIFVSNKMNTILQKNIFLSGDALFAFQPSFAQGASQSIETANDIFDDIKNNSDRLYKKRISKIHSVEWRSRLNQFLFHLKNPFNILVRNVALKYLSKNEKFIESYLGRIYRN
tara:strand:+ start:710 stop:1840 length:1131 start_codon:yes stop_codon:yes gene_type:complete